MSPPVAIVTGASSGIGLALVQHLIELKWNVVMVDITPPTVTVPGTMFIRTDISSWDQQVDMFQRAFEWQDRIDFCALNAGVDDRDDIFTTLDQPLLRPDLSTFEVNLIGTYYGIKLASYYMVKTSSKAGKVNKGGKIVLTGSGASIWPITILPQYTATKHALIGLGQSIGLSEGARLTNVRLTVLCPAVVATGFPPQGVLDALTPDQLTPMQTLMEGYDYLADLKNVHRGGWVENGPTGLVIEANGEQLIPHHLPSRTSEGSFPTPEAATGVLQAYKERVGGHARRHVEQSM